jgi:hypothetical protein
MTRSEATTLDGHSTRSPSTTTWTAIRCVGGYEHALGDYWPSHVAPILIEAGPDGRWRRWRYTTRRGTGVVLLAPVGGFVDPDAMSFAPGGYLTCPPVPFGPRSHLIALPGGDLAVRSGAPAAVLLLIRLAVRSRRDRVLVGRCLRGIRNALAG